MSASYSELYKVAFAIVCRHFLIVTRKIRYSHITVMKFGIRVAITLIALGAWVCTLLRENKQ